jgi:hypothetical protein
LLASSDRGCVRRPGARLPIRLQAALTALVFVVSSLIGLVHEATTKHVRCAEHGELIDGDPALATRAAAKAPEPDSVVRDAGVPPVHGHEHCLVTSTSRASRIEVRPPAVAPAPLAISEVASAAPRVIASRGLRIYRTAPKTSPPA